MSWRYSTDSKRIYPFSSIQHLIAQSPFTVTLDIINVGITQIRRVKFQRTISAILKDVLGNNRSFSVFDNIYKDVCVKKNFHFLSTSKPNIHLVRSSAASFGVNLSQSTSSSISGSMFTSAIFLARYSSSALRLTSSASRMGFVHILHDIVHQIDFCSLRPVKDGGKCRRLGFFLLLRS